MDNNQSEGDDSCRLQYEVEDFEEVKTAVVNFAQREDPKASIVAAFRYYCSPGANLTVQCFYDGPLPENDGPFQVAELLEIDHKTKRGGGDTVRLQSRRLPAKVELPDLRVLPPPKWSELVVYDNYHFFDYQTSFVNVNEALDVQDVQVYVVETASETPIAISLNLGAAPIKTVQVRRVVAADQSASICECNFLSAHSPLLRQNPRGRWGSVIVDICTKEIIDEIGRQASKAAREMPGHGGKPVVIDIWPFTETMFNNATECAWPHVKDQPNGPILAYFLWEGSENDKFWIQQMERAMKAIKKKVDKARGPPRNRSQSTRTRR
ncbi:hypothetical protein EV363DRAFT_1554935 [Boletus edulis]|nr:hypothetical protein EV363DRAFT_1554935 [Boletus edulis]